MNTFWTTRELNHRGTEAQSHRTEKPQIAQMNAGSIAHRTVATTKTRRHEAVTKTSRIDSAKCRRKARQVRRIFICDVRRAMALKCDDFARFACDALRALRGSNTQPRFGQSLSRAQPLTSVPLSVPLCLCGEKPTSAPESLASRQGNHFHAPTIGARP